MNFSLVMPFKFCTANVFHERWTEVQTTKSIRGNVCRCVIYFGCNKFSDKMCCVHLMAFINHIHEFLSEATDGMQFFRGRARAHSRPRLHCWQICMHECNGRPCEVDGEKKKTFSQIPTRRPLSHNGSRWFPSINFSLYCRYRAVQSVIDEC